MRRDVIRVNLSFPFIQVFAEVLIYLGYLGFNLRLGNHAYLIDSKYASIAFLKQQPLGFL